MGGGGGASFVTVVGEEQSREGETETKEERGQGKLFSVCSSVSVSVSDYAVVGDQSIYILSLTYHHITVEAFLVNYNSSVAYQLHLAAVVRPQHLSHSSSRSKGI